MAERANTAKKKINGTGYNAAAYHRNAPTCRLAQATWAAHTAYTGHAQTVNGKNTTGSINPIIQHTKPTNFPRGV